MILLLQKTQPQGSRREGQEGGKKGIGRPTLEPNRIFSLINLQEKLSEMISCGTELQETGTSTGLTVCSSVM